MLTSETTIYQTLLVLHANKVVYLARMVQSVIPARMVSINKKTELANLVERLHVRTVHQTLINVINASLDLRYSQSQMLIRQMSALIATILSV